jgi:hypothetical protein
MQPPATSAATAIASSIFGASQDSHDEETDFSFGALKDRFLHTISGGAGDAAAADAANSSLLMLRLRLTGSISLTISDDRAPIVSLDTSFGSTLAVRNLASISASAYVTELGVRDLATPRPMRPMLVSFAAAAAGASRAAMGDDDLSADPSTDKQAEPNTHPPSNDTMGKNKAIIIYEAGTAVTGRASLRVTAQQLEVALNYYCLERLAEMFAIPMARAARLIPAFAVNDYIGKTARAENSDIITVRRAAEVATEAAKAIIGDHLDISIEAAGPKVVFSDDSSGDRDRGFFVVDLGRVRVDGSVSSTAGLKLAISASAFCAGLPLRAQEIYRYNAREEYFISPLEVLVDLTGGMPGDSAATDTAVSVVLTAPMKLTLTADTILRLVDKFNSGLSFVDAVTIAFNKAPYRNPLAEAALRDAAERFAEGFAQALNDSSVTDAFRSLSVANSGEGSGSSSGGNLLSIEADIIAAAKNRRRLTTQKKIAEVNVALPAMLVDMQYTFGAPSTLQSMLLTFSRIQLGVVKRPYDTSVVANVGSMTIEDSMQPRDRKYLMQSVESIVDNGITTDASPFVRLVVTQIFDRHSELAKGVYGDALAALRVDGDNRTAFKRRRMRTEGSMKHPLGGIDEEVDITLGAIQISVDANAVQHLHALSDRAIQRFFETRGTLPTSGGALNYDIGAHGEYQEGLRGSAIGALRKPRRPSWTRRKPGEPKAAVVVAEDVRDTVNVHWAEDALDKDGRRLLVLKMVVGRVIIEILEVTYMYRCL